MAWVMNHVLCLLLTLALCGCTCTLAGCAEADAKAEKSSRFEVETDLVAFNNTFVVDILTDTETGRRWMVVVTAHGVATTPLEGSQDGTVSD